MWYFNPASFGFAEFTPWVISELYAGCGKFKEYKLSANSSTQGLIKHPVPEGVNDFSVTPAVEYTGTMRGWYQAQAYAVSQGGRLMTKSEMLSFLAARGNQYVYSGDHWVAVDHPRDWIQVGNHWPTGRSHRDHWGYPSWGDSHNGGGSHTRTVGIARFNQNFDCSTPASPERADKCLQILVDTSATRLIKFDLQLYP